MLYLILAILSSVMIALLMRISAGKIKANISMLAVNYLACLLLAAGYSHFQVFSFRAEGFPAAVGMGAVNGVFYLLGFLLLQINTRKNGVVLSSVFLKLGLLVPIVVSVLLFGERPALLQILGFVLAVAAIILINYEKNTSLRGPRMALVLMLLAGGSGDAMSKVYEVLGPAAYGDSFLFYTFVSAFLLCVVLILWRKERPGKQELLFGLLVGVPNFFSAKFLLMALGQLPAVVVYPTFSVGTILLVTLAGVCLFRERLRRTQWASLAVILVALVMLNI